MKPAFLINGSVLFEPDKRRLGPLAGYPEHAVLLHGPVSECLLQLLEHNGEVLTQRYLFAAVWEKQGAVVTTNALYQTIASIRKALKTAGLAENVVQTVPKEGFKSIAQIETGTLQDFIDSAVPVPAEIPSQRHASSYSLIAYFLAGLLFIVSCSVLYFQLEGQRASFDDYQYVGKIKGCEVYSSWHDEMRSRSAFIARDGRYPIQCRSGGVAYITLNRFQNGTSVMICDKKLSNDDAQCDAIVYREQYHESE